jgi:hypothetical protein
MPKLILHPGTPQAREFELQPGRNYVGRGFTNDFRIEDASVSVSHVQLMVTGNTVSVKDLGSTNGTFINAAPIKEGFLQPGQTLQVGGVEMLFAGDLPAEAVTAGYAPTLALPRPGGGRFTVPSAGPARPGMPIASAAPAPVFRQGPVPFNPGAPVPQQPQPEPVPIAAALAAFAPIERPRPSVSATTGNPVFRCMANGFGAAFLIAVLWTGFAAYFRFAPAPYFSWAAGLICGFAVRSGSRGRSGAPFSLVATGFCLLAVFAGDLGQVFAIQTASFRNENLLGLLAGAFSAWWLGGGTILSSIARRERMAG